MDALAIVEAFGAAWAAHDLEATLSLVTDDCAFESTEPGPDGIRYEGRDAIRGAWQPIFDDKDAVFRGRRDVCHGGSGGAMLALFLAGRSRAGRRRVPYP